MTTSPSTHTRPGDPAARATAPRPRSSRRADTLVTAVATWFVLGLFLDAYAHANLPGLETFFTPWHAVFYSGFAATAGAVLWPVWRHHEHGGRGLAAVPLGYGPALLALPAFAAFGAADLLWHTLLGIETTIDIFFSPSHLGLLVAMIVIVTTPLRAAWAERDPASRPGLPAVLTLAYATSLVTLFLTYGNALLFDPHGIVEAFSTLDHGDANWLAASIVVTSLVLLAPLLLLARRWWLPVGAATLIYTATAAISAILNGFNDLAIPTAIVAAGIGVDLLARWIRPAPGRQAAYRAFGATAPLLTWTVYLAVASAVVGRVPAVPELWTGMPLIGALLGWLLAILMAPPTPTARTSTA